MLLFKQNDFVERLREFGFDDIEGKANCVKLRAITDFGKKNPASSEFLLFFGTIDVFIIKIALASRKHF